MRTLQKQKKGECAVAMYPLHTEKFRFAKPDLTYLWCWVYSLAIDVFSIKFVDFFEINLY